MRDITQKAVNMLIYSTALSEWERIMNEDIVNALGELNFDFNEFYYGSAQSLMRLLINGLENRLAETKE